jgi:hypothetical protein
MVRPPISSHIGKSSALHRLPFIQSLNFDAHSGFQRKGRWSMRRFDIVIATTTGLALSLTACGGTGAGISSTPPPLAGTPPPAPSPTPASTPTPSPSPTASPAAAFQAIPAQIFASAPPASPPLVALGEGWVADYLPNQPFINIREADQVAVSYDSNTSTYTVSVPGVGTGTLMQVSPTEFARTRTTVAGENASGATPKLIDWFPPGSTAHYNYVVYGSWWADGVSSGDTRTLYTGALAVAQPAPVSAIPVSGTATYVGDVFGGMPQNVGDAIGGHAQFDFDFLAATLSGHADLILMCMMGCSYAPTRYDFTATQFAHGTNTFSGHMTTSNLSGRGEFSGVFAGPGAEEIAARFQVPYLDPDLGMLTTASGVMFAKKN